MSRGYFEEKGATKKSLAELQVTVNIDARYLRLSDLNRLKKKIKKQVKESLRMGEVGDYEYFNTRVNKVDIYTTFVRIVKFPLNKA